MTIGLPGTGKSTAASYFRQGAKKRQFNIAHVQAKQGDETIQYGIMSRYRSKFPLILCLQVSLLYCTVLYCTVLYCTVLYCTVPYCTVLYCTTPYSTLMSSCLKQCEGVMGWDIALTSLLATSSYAKIRISILLLSPYFLYYHVLSSILSSLVSYTL